jgi:hypothetical protein
MRSVSNSLGCSCFHDEEYKADHLLAQLFQLIMGGTFEAYARCPPRRYIRRLDTGLIFDAPAKVGLFRYRHANTQHHPTCAGSIAPHSPLIALYQSPLRPISMNSPLNSFAKQLGTHWSGPCCLPECPGLVKARFLRKITKVRRLKST